MTITITITITKTMTMADGRLAKAGVGLPLLRGPGGINQLRQMT